MSRSMTKWKSPVEIHVLSDIFVYLYLSLFIDHIRQALGLSTHAIYSKLTFIQKGNVHLKRINTGYVVLSILNCLEDHPVKISTLHFTQTGKCSVLFLNQSVLFKEGRKERKNFPFWICHYWKIFLVIECFQVAGVYIATCWHTLDYICMLTCIYIHKHYLSYPIYKITRDYLRDFGKSIAVSGHVAQWHNLIVLNQAYDWHDITINEWA